MIYSVFNFCYSIINVVELKVEINIDNIIDDTLYWKCFRGFVSTLGTSIVLRKNSFVRAILQPHFAALFFTMLSWESLHNLYDQFGQLTHHHKSVYSCTPLKLRPCSFLLCLQSCECMTCKSQTWRNSTKKPLSSVNN